MHRLLELVFAAMAALFAVAAQGQALTGTLKKIADSGTISLGYRIDAAPFSFQSPDGAPAGYTVDLCKRVVASLQQQLKLQLKERWVPVTSADRLPRTLSGDVDLECGTTSVTLGRMEQVDFSSLVFVDSAAFLTLAGGPRNLSELAGKTIGVLAGSTAEARLPLALKARIVDARIVRLADSSDALRALQDKRIDAFANDRLALIGRVLLARPDKAQFSLSEDDFAVEPYALMMRRDPAFRLAVNRALAQVYGGPVLEELYLKHFGKVGKPSPILASLYLLHAYGE